MSDQRYNVWMWVQIENLNCVRSLFCLLSLALALSVNLSLWVCMCVFNACLPNSLCVCLSLSSSYLTVLAIINTPFCVWVWVCFREESKLHTHARVHTSKERETHTKRKKNIRTKDLNKYTWMYEIIILTRARFYALSHSLPHLLWSFRIQTFFIRSHFVNGIGGPTVAGNGKIEQRSK